ncbi:TPA: fimbrial protein [Citrobacter freundii]
MKSLLLILIISLFSQYGYSKCSQHMSIDNNFVVRDDLMLSGVVDTQTFNNVFSDSTCSGRNTITKAPASEFIVGMGQDDSVRLKVEIAWVNSDSTTINGHISNLSGAYRVSISEDTSSTPVNYTANGNYSIRIDDITIMTSANVGNAFWTCLFREPFNLFSCIRNVLANYTSDAMYKSNLLITYNKKSTTCAPRNLTITLDPVPISNLINKGEVSDFSRQGDIILDCKDQVRNATLTSRDISVYLQSDLVWEENNSVLKPDNDNGVGFILRDSEHKPLRINSVNAISSILKKIPKGNMISTVEIIPVFANYYVVDPAKVKSGALQSKALIIVSYN